MPNLKSCFFVLAALAFFLPLDLKADTLPSIFDHLYRDTLLQLTIETDLKKLVKNKYKEKFQSARLTYMNQAGDTIRRTVRLRARGNVRKRVCFYPPYKIKFQKKELRAEGFETSWNDIKVVTGCQNSEISDQYVLKEYLAYQLFQALSDRSLRTQLTEIQYIDIRKKRKSFKSYAFLIEETAQLASRFNGRVTKPSIISNNHIDPETLDEVSFFQYMIGNSDYAIANSHNILLIASKDYAKPLPVPYDFDYSGLVNTHYAIPGDRLPIENVTERYFLGVCRPDSVYSAVAQKFIMKKEELYQIVQELPLLDKKQRKWSLNYLEEFFALLEKEEAFQKIISRQCLNLN